jgi:hypothetical protein
MLYALRFFGLGHDCFLGSYIYAQLITPQTSKVNIAVLTFMILSLES